MRSKEIVRNKGVNIITNYLNSVKSSKRFSDKTNILQDVKITRRFFKNHPEIIVGKSDKGNTTVVIERSAYFAEMNKIFSDSALYLKLNFDPTARTEKKCKELIKDLVTKGSISKWKGEALKNHNSVAPKAYGLRKTHKQNVSYRPIISNIDSPCYHLSKFVHNILSQVCSTFHRSAKSSFEVAEKLKGVKLHTGYILISLDVVSLFPSIPKSLIIEMITKKWNWFEAYTELSKAEFIRTLKFIFDSSYFVMDGDFYRQLDGTAMGSPCSPSLANLVMELCVNKFFV